MKICVFTTPDFCSRSCFLNVIWQYVGKKNWRFCWFWWANRYLVNCSTFSSLSLLHHSFILYIDSNFYLWVFLLQSRECSTALLFARISSTLFGQHFWTSFFLRLVSLPILVNCISFSLRFSLWIHECSLGAIFILLLTSKAKVCFLFCFLLFVWDLLLRVSFFCLLWNSNSSSFLLLPKTLSFLLRIEQYFSRERKPTIDPTKNEVTHWRQITFWREEEIEENLQ